MRKDGKVVYIKKSEREASESGKAGSGVEKAEKQLSIKEMIAKGMTTEEIKEYRKQHGLTMVKPILTIKGVSANYTDYDTIMKQSKQQIWIDSKNPHAAFYDESGGSVSVKGDKSNKLELLNMTNTAIIHARNINPDTATKRDINRLNQVLDDIGKLGYDVPQVSIQRDETLIYAKRKRFTKAIG